MADQHYFFVGGGGRGDGNGKIQGDKKGKFSHIPLSFPFGTVSVGEVGKSPTLGKFRGMFGRGKRETGKKGMKREKWRKRKEKEKENEKKRQNMEKGKSIKSE